MMKYLLTAFLGCALFSQALAQETMSIAVFGDSLAAGYGVAPEESFPAKLEAKLQKDGYKVRVINDGTSGDTTADGVSKVDYVIGQAPKAVIIILGGNDLLRALPTQETKNNLNVIMEKFSKAGIKMLVTGQKASLSFGVKYASEYNSIFCDLAKKYDARCYPFFLEGLFGHAELMQSDGIHPNAQGVDVVVDKIYVDVKKLLKK